MTKLVKKTLTYENVVKLLEGKEKVLNTFSNIIFPRKSQTDETEMKILTPKQFLPRLTIAVAQVK